MRSLVPCLGQRDRLPLEATLQWGKRSSFYLTPRKRRGTWSKAQPLQAASESTREPLTHMKTMLDLGRMETTADSVPSKSLQCDLQSTPGFRTGKGKAVARLSSGSQRAWPFPGALSHRPHQGEGRCFSCLAMPASRAWRHPWEAQCRGPSMSVVHCWGP